MNKKNNRTCLCCGKSYRFCHTCTEYESLPMWYNLFHDQNCHDIWYVLSDFESGFLTKAEAQEKIKNLDVSVIKNEDALKSLSKLNEPNPDQPAETQKAPDLPASNAPLSVSEELKQHESKGHMQSKSRVKKNSK